MTVKAAVIGHPIAHSKSPLIHNYWLKKYGIDGSYEAFDVAPENLAEAVRGLAAQGYAGFNVTLPHKEKMLDLCDAVEDLALGIGAVNTVVVNAGKISGGNTDAFGFLENIRSMKPGFNFAHGPAVVLGAGGAARAVVFALANAGVSEIRMVNRTRAKADLFAQVYPVGKIFDWEKRADILMGANLLVNTTSMGMAGQESLDLNLAELPPDALVNDIVYTPLMTDLLARAKLRGNPVVTGIGMLLHQARPAFKAWFGIMPEIDAGLIKLVLP